MNESGMVKVELSYNPYLLETNIKFNGQMPKVNTLVEEYQQSILQNWIDKMPSFFYDEINGYDFEIEFTGTTLDYDDVKEAFLKAGADETLVKIFHKNELEGRYSKMHSVVNLLQWLENHRNGKFDYMLFMEKNEELFHKYFKCIVINGFQNVEVLFKEYPMSVEFVDDIHELDNIELFHTPLLICIDQDSMDNLKDNLKYLLLRKDVHQEQLFFIIQSSLEVTKIECEIKDFGIISPKIVRNTKDKQVKKYLESYPVTDYIYNTIRLLKANEKMIVDQLQKETAESEITNRTVCNRMDALEDVIKRLKNSAEKFSGGDNLEIFAQMWDAKRDFIECISNWKNKKTKITKEEEAVIAAKELDGLLGKWYQEFNQKISNIAIGSQNAMEIKFREWYSRAEVDLEYEPDVSGILILKSRNLPGIWTELLKLKEERYVMKEEGVGRWFKSSEDKIVETVFETAFSYQKWRDYAIGIAEPIADGIIKRYGEVLKNYSLEMAEKYQEHLEQLIKKQTRIKENLSAQLSDDEWRLWEDNDWLVEFQEQLRNLEQG